MSSGSKLECIKARKSGLIADLSIPKACHAEGELSYWGTSEPEECNLVMPFSLAKNAT